jgi:hypothetical protein
LIASGPALGNMVTSLRQTVRAAFGPALGNRGRSKKAKVKRQKAKVRSKKDGVP